MSRYKQVTSSTHTHTHLEIVNDNRGEEGECANSREEGGEREGRGGERGRGGEGREGGEGRGEREGGGREVGSVTLKATTVHAFIVEVKLMNLSPSQMNNGRLSLDNRNWLSLAKRKED